MPGQTGPQRPSDIEAFPAAVVGSNDDHCLPRTSPLSQSSSPVFLKATQGDRCCFHLTAEKIQVIVCVRISNPSRPFSEVCAFFMCHAEDNLETT